MNFKSVWSSWYIVVLATSALVVLFGSAGAMKIQPFSDVKIGASIHDVDIETISEIDFDHIHDAILKYKVVIVKNQASLSVEGQRRFTQRFGPLHVHLESSSHLPGYSDVNVVSNIKNENGSYIGLFGAHVENFHSDLSWLVGLLQLFFFFKCCFVNIKQNIRCTVYIKDPDSNQDHRPEVSHTARRVR